MLFPFSNSSILSIYFIFVHICVCSYALDLTQSVRYPIHHFSYALMCYPNDERYVNLTANTSHSTTYLYVCMCEQFFCRFLNFCVEWNIVSISIYRVFITLVKFPVLNWINKVFSLLKYAILLHHIQMIRYSKLDDMWFLGQWKLFLRINMFIGK